MAAMVGGWGGLHVSGCKMQSVNLLCWTLCFASSLKAALNF